MTIPEVFIIETLSLDDEASKRYEGKIISNILHLNRKSSTYYYFRTKKELIMLADVFVKSRCRYLHISCHGNLDSMITTLDEIPLVDLGKLLRPCIRNKRVFVSACEMVNEIAAQALIPTSGCYSLIGPSKPVAFGDAAILWASFYHLVFNFDPDRIKRNAIVKYCQRIVDLFGVPLNYYSSSRGEDSGYKLLEIKPTQDG